MRELFNLDAYGNKEDDLTKKEHTYDDDGNILAVKAVKTDYLPQIQTQYTKTNIPEAIAVTLSEFNRNLKLKGAQWNMKEGSLSKDNSLNIMKQVDRSGRKVELNTDYLNLKDNLKPNVGVMMIEGSDVLRG